MYCLDPTTLLNMFVWSNDPILVQFVRVSAFSICVFPGLCWAVCPPRSSSLLFCSVLPLFFSSFAPFFHLPTHSLAMSCRDSVQAPHCAGFQVRLSQLLQDSALNSSMFHMHFLDRTGLLTLWMPPVTSEAWASSPCRWPGCSHPPFCVSR